METSDNNATLEKVSLNSSEVAFAIKKDPESPSLGLYIPTLMSEIDMGDNVWEKQESIPNNMIVNKNKTFSFGSITLCNYYMVEPYDPAIYYTETELGEQVRIKFLDNDIKKCYYYDDTYKMTDALMEETLSLNERVALLEEMCATLTETVSTFQGKIGNLQAQIDSLKG